MFNGYEQVLLDDISDVFGPFIECISMKQNVYRAASQTIPSNCQFASMISLDIDELVAARSPDNSTVHFLATTQVPVQRPRILSGPSIRVQWLREIRIVFRATKERPFFLHAFTYGSQAISLQTLSPPLTRPPLAVIDFSPCRTLEVLSIEDFDKHGRPQQLRVRQRAGVTAVDPFHPKHGIKLPSCLKSLEMIGLSANRFNFGWLRATPRLERLQILGMRRQDIYLEVIGIQDTLWDWEGVMLPHLGYLAVHHSPAQHFRFEILRQCPRLDCLDVREIHPQVVTISHRDYQATTAGDTRDFTRLVGSTTLVEKPLLSRCRLDILPVQDGALLLTAIDLTSLVQAFLPHVTHLHVDGVPVRLLVEATSGPPWSPSLQCCGSTVRKSQPVHVLTREKACAQDIMDFGLVMCSGQTDASPAAGSPCTHQDVQSDSVNVGSDSIWYTIDNKKWERFCNTRP